MNILIILLLIYTLSHNVIFIYVFILIHLYNIYYCYDLLSQQFDYNYYFNIAIFHIIHPATRIIL